MEIIILTCPYVAADRLPSQILQLTRTIELGLITGVKLICMQDAEALQIADIQYCPSEWKDDIGIGWQIFSKNISAQVGRSLEEFGSLSNEQASRYFPPRMLTNSEHSIAYRHIIALKYVAGGKSTCLILEDDAMVKDIELFCEMLGELKKCCKPRVFYDLADGYIPIIAENKKSFNVGNLRYIINPIGLTRTLMAYAMTPRTAREILNSLEYYSLPIDMQLQVALKRLNMPGLSLLNSPFVHGSKSDIVASSVYQT